MPKKKKITGQDIVDAARRYLGLPYQHQGRDKWGLDCGGLILVVGRELNLTELEFLGYSNAPDGVTFENLLRQELVETAEKQAVRVGDILAMDYSECGRPNDPKIFGIQHTGFVTDLSFFDEKTGEGKLKIIHAKRKFGVVEQFLHGADLKAWVKTFRVKAIK